MKVMMSITEAAQRVGVSPFTLRSWVRARRLPFVKLGRRVVLEAEDVEAFLRAHRVEPRPDTR